MKRTLLIWASMACMTVHSVMAQDAAVNKIIEIGQTDNQVMDHLDVLTPPPPRRPCDRLERIR